MAIAFVSNIVLARLLSPDDYGVIGMLMIFIVVANTFVDGGFGSALIQKKEPTQEDYSTIFWWNLLLSIVLYCGLFIAAPYIAKFYNLPLLSAVLRVQSVVLILNSLSIIQQNRLRKTLLFKKLATVSIISSIISLIITIYLAYKGWGVWALVAHQIIISLFNAILYGIVGRWLPSFVFSKDSFKQLFGFGGFVLTSNLINTLCNNIQGLLIGKFFLPANLGYYTQARKLEEVASTSLETVVNQVSYPILAQLQNDKHKLIAMLKKMVLSISFISIPLMIILIILSYQLIELIYSEKWLPCVPYFNILCLAGMAVSLQGVHYYAVASIGKSKELFSWTLVKRFWGLVYLCVGIIVWGMDGLLWAIVAGSWTILIINAYLTDKYVGYKLKQQVIDILPTLISVAFSYVVPYIVINCFNLQYGIASFIHSIFFVIIYVLLAHTLRFEAYTQLKNVGLEYINKLRMQK